MVIGDFVVDVCRSNDPTKLKDLVAASKAYWTSPHKGYKLLSDAVGRDFMRIYSSKIENDAFDPGNPIGSHSGDVILVFERSVGSE